MLNCGAGGFDICSDCSVTPIRLVGGEDNKTGVVELCYKGRWRPVCDDDWTDTDANVVCKQLGFLGFGECCSCHSCI